jgi:hypothetical protein
LSSIYAGTPQYFTIDQGAGTTWQVMQDAASTVSGKAFKTSDTGAGRNGGTDGVIVPDAAHFMYRATKDGGNTQDWYFVSTRVSPRRPGDGGPCGSGPWILERPQVRRSGAREAG